jgi:hypothetical protein
MHWLTCTSRLCFLYLWRVNSLGLLRVSDSDDGHWRYARALLLYQHGKNTSQYSSSNGGISNILRSSLHTSKQHCVRLTIERNTVLLWYSLADRHLQQSLCINGPWWRTRMGLLDVLQLWQWVTQSSSSTTISTKYPLSIVLFSVIVIQWVTSKDNAGTVSSTSSGEARRSRDLSSGVNRISTPSELHETPSSTLADISLVPTRRRSREVDRDDPYERKTPNGDGAKVINNPSSTVMVTTTIKREVRPRSYDLTGLHIESSTTCGCGCLISLKSDAMDERFLPLQTKITSGGAHFLESSDQKSDPCHCQTFPLREMPSGT